MTAASLVLVALFAAAVLAAPQQDLITELPGWNGPTPTAQYSGYMQVSPTNFLHYWFVESSNNPATDPVILWLNGGPGCSSLDGFFYEQGPFRFVDPNDNGANGVPQLRLNTAGSWNSFANMIFLEAPAGVGMSYSNPAPNTYVTNDNITAAQNLEFLVQFFQAFPEYAQNEFFIAGESYAGVYVPTLAYWTYMSNKAGQTNINLQGIAVGNGCTGYNNGACSPAGTQIRGDFLYGHNLYSAQTYNAIMVADCFNPLVNTSECSGLLMQMAKEIGPVNIYDVYAQCINGGLDLQHPISKVKRELWDPKNVFGAGLGGPLECIDGIGAAAYMNNETVKAALHVNPALNWTICTALDYTTTFASVLPLYDVLIPNIRVLIYNGNVDACVPFNGNEEWTSSMGYDVVTQWAPWKVNKQLAGYVTKYAENGFQFVSVLGAGHPVPEYRPVQAHYMIKRFVENAPIDA
eukprot:c26105_g1_i1.p1 GENE.c26105_g1_i1~~c26105_g1_i1.p1  ORF type:complete len:472 (+),score=104.62 c26105_g1_i1:28-1416(+)